MGNFWNKPNNFRGTKKDDVLVGNDADNWLWGDQGEDVLTGNGGSDTFRMSRGLDTVIDFTDGEDQIYLWKGDAGDVADIINSAVQVNGGVYLNYDFHNSEMFLQGFNLNDLTTDDFVF